MLLLEPSLRYTLGGNILSAAQCSAQKHRFMCDWSASQKKKLASLYVSG